MLLLLWCNQIKRLLDRSDTLLDYLGNKGAYSESNLIVDQADKVSLAPIARSFLDLGEI
jgi:hypothetical protein